MNLNQELLPSEAQTVLSWDAAPSEDPRFLKEQLVTYIGNKRSLLPTIREAISQVADALGRKPRALDAFSGSGVVSRLLKSQASHVISNDLEAYARVLGDCYLSNRDEVAWGRLGAAIDSLNAEVAAAGSLGGFIERLYAPADDDRIQPGERVFYTRDNARRLDHFAQRISEQDADLVPYLLGPLLSAASVHANTAGVFKGFYKDRETGIGRFGGKGEDALSRIKGTIELRPPVLSRCRSTYEILQVDANELPDLVDEVDLAYLDPPYNQHPYGSNYFMLNLLVDYREPREVSRVSGIPTDWRRSGYNVKKENELLLRDLVGRLPARFLLISFNDEGYVSPQSMNGFLQEVGSVKEFRTVYNTYRGSRNLRERSLHVTEHLYLVDREGA
jgi:adenine-specific DNA-methyltransferase